MLSVEPFKGAFHLHWCVVGFQVAALEPTTTMLLLIESYIEGLTQSPSGNVSQRRFRARTYLLV